MSKTNNECNIHKFKNAKTNDKHRFRLNLTTSLNLKIKVKNIALANLSIYYTWNNIKSSLNNNKFKLISNVSTNKWNESFDLPDGSYNVEDIQIYVNYIISKHETIDTKDLTVKISVNRVLNKIRIELKRNYEVKL